jgi:hypothetical protein
VQKLGLGQRREWPLRGAASGALSFESVAADSPPTRCRAAGRMRSPSLAWLLGGVVLLAASASCNHTVQGEKLDPGGLELPRGWVPGIRQVVEARQVHERCSASVHASVSPP